MGTVGHQSQLGKGRNLPQHAGVAMLQTISHGQVGRDCLRSCADWMWQKVYQLHSWLAGVGSCNGCVPVLRHARHHISVATPRPLLVPGDQPVLPPCVLCSTDMLL
jgi:hypothetical protein